MSLDFKQFCVFCGKSGTFVVSKVMSPMRFQRSSFLHLLFGMHLSLSLPVQFVQSVQSVQSVSILPTEVSGSIGEIPAVKRCFVMFIQCYCIHHIYIYIYKITYIYIILYIYYIHYSFSFPCTIEAKCREASTGIGMHAHLFALQL